MRTIISCKFTSKPGRLSIMSDPTEQSSGFDDRVFPPEKAADGFIGIGFSHTGKSFRWTVKKPSSIPY